MSIFMLNTDIDLDFEILGRKAVAQNLGLFVKTKVQMFLGVTTTLLSN